MPDLQDKPTGWTVRCQGCGKDHFVLSRVTSVICGCGHRGRAHYVEVQTDAPSEEALSIYDKRRDCIERWRLGDPAAALDMATEIERLRGIIQSALSFHQPPHIRAALSVAFTKRVERQSDVE